MKYRIASLLLAALPLLAQTRTIDGVAPAGRMSVAVTLMPISDADDVTATTIAGASGKFHFAGLKPGQYNVAATSPNACGGATTVDLTKESATNVVLTAPKECRTVTGTVLDAKGAHVVAGHFHDKIADLYSIEVRSGHYTMSVPAGGAVVVQALAPHEASIETEVTGSGDVNLTLEHRYESAPASVRKWITANAIPLQTVEAGHGFADMEPLRAVVGDARIVALGEATHGTREFFQFKHRMLEFLVAKMGFSVFAIEASQPDAMAVDDYVLHGAGDPATALANLQFWTWNTEEVLDMIKWMRAWNEDPSHTTKVRFYGFDMQNPKASERLLRNWLTDHLGDALPLLQKKSYEQLAAKVDAYSPHDASWQNARHFVDLLVQGAPMATGSAAATRDPAMAKNIEWIAAQQPKARIVVWAHNGHVSAERLPFAKNGTMGSHLRETFGRDLVVIGFAFDHGTFRAVTPGKGLEEHKAEPLGDTLDHTLATSGPRIFVLDLRKARNEVRDYFASGLPMRSIGAVYFDDRAKSFVARIHPLRSYDAIFFINETTPSRGVRTPQPKPAPSAVNLSFDDGLTGWQLSKQSSESGYTARAKTEGCVSGGCAEVSITDRKGEGTGVLMQRIDATPYRGKKIHLHAKVKSAVTGDASARIWLRVDRPNGTGFFDNMQDRAPHALPDWTDLDIAGDVAPDAEAIAFGFLMLGDGTAAIDEVTLTEGSAGVPPAAGESPARRP